jgi:radical SAM protein with 4Fe4S-binding SPASM domain
MDKFRIDSHKLLFHPARVGAWQEGALIYPIYMEVSPSGACNHRCTFCGLDFMGYKAHKLDTAMLMERLTEMGRLGLKSIMYAGEGEPFLHADMVDLILHTKAAGIDVALTTNGTLMAEEISRRILPVTSWIKVSCNAGDAETYAKVHRTKAEHFDLAVRNLKRAVELRRELGTDCTLGAQSLLLPENRHSMLDLARTARDIGLDYLVVKPYSQHPSSVTDQYKDVHYEDSEALAEELRGLSTESFSVIVRLNAMKKWDERSRPYGKCLALPFWSYIDARGGVWGCSVFLGDERFLYGNIYEESFEAIWTGEKRRKALEWFDREFDCAGCRVNCRMDEINRYLWELKHPGAHVNFI